MGASVKVLIQLLQPLGISLVLIGAAGAESIPIREASGITRLGNDRQGSPERIDDSSRPIQVLRRSASVPALPLIDC